MNERTTTGDLAVSSRPDDTHTDELVHQFEGSRGGAGVAADPSSTPLFPKNEAEDMRSRWSEIQTGFVDEPRRAVEQADELVATCIKRLAETFSEERRRMEEQWDRDGDVSTEDFRVALQRYRSFFARLLSV
jgi:hypothetical protein